MSVSNSACDGSIYAVCLLAEAIVYNTESHVAYRLDIFLSSRIDKFCRPTHAYWYSALHCLQWGPYIWRSLRSSLIQVNPRRIMLPRFNAQVFRNFYYRHPCGWIKSRDDCSKRV